ncbi:hypothetical protein AB0K16_54330 [Nonomuraea jabiensis]|uniref:hypothetical protein n=1 Tax=Nonomuraea jabiensis TaxID=882448 RepID=UPI00342B335D
MLSSRTRLIFGSIAIVVTGITCLSAAPAKANSKPPCTFGTWTLVHKATSSRSSADDWAKRSGVTGVKVTIGKHYASFSFEGSTREYATGLMNGEEYSWNAIYRGRLKIRVKIDGLSKGLISFSGKSASGNATFQSVSTSPERRTNPVRSLVDDLRKGQPESMTPSTGRFACSKKQLVIRENYNMLGNKFSNTLTMRRVP